jgi:hypothetical protein
MAKTSAARRTAEKSKVVLHGPAGVSPLASERMRGLVRSVLDVVPLSDALQVFTEYVQHANSSDALLAALSLRGERAKPLIESRSGSALGTEDVGQLLRVNPETVRNWLTLNKLVGYRAPGDRTRIRLPAWQFRGHQGIHDWVVPLIAAYGDNGWALLDFVTVPRSSLSGMSYLSWLQNGQHAEVIAAAKRSNPV